MLLPEAVSCEIKGPATGMGYTLEWLVRDDLWTQTVRHIALAFFLPTL